MNTGDLLQIVKLAAGDKGRGHPGWRGLGWGMVGNAAGSSLGAVPGLLAGAAIGSVTGDAAKGMAIGAGAGQVAGSIIGSGMAMKHVTKNQSDRFSKRHPYVSGLLGPWSQAYVGATEK